LSKSDRKHFDKLWLVRDELLEPHDLLLQAKALVLCALPYKRTKEVRITRKARVGRDAWISVTFGAVGEGAILPYGADRAVLGWIQTRAYKDGFIQYDTLRGFFSDFGLNDSGTNYRRFRERVDRLTTLAISIRGENESATLVENISPIKKAFFPKTSAEMRGRREDEEVGQMLMIPQRYGFQLDPDFWRYLNANPVPLPLPLMRLFHARPKAWDFCQFLLFRCFSAKTESTIPWQVFQEQLGSEDTHTRRLRQTLRECLKEIKTVYPDIPAVLLHGSQGLRVAPWRPPQLSP